METPKTPETLRALFGAHGLEGLFDTTALGKDGTVYDAKDEGRAHADAWQKQLEAARELLREAIEFSGEDGPGDDERGICYGCGEAVQLGHPHKDDCSYRNWLRRAQDAVKTLAASEPPGEEGT